MTHYKFGPILISESQVFFKSKLTIGIVNLKPITARFLLEIHKWHFLPFMRWFISRWKLLNYVLVLPKRHVPRMSELTQQEASDLILSAQKVGNVVEKHYHGSSLTMTIQDGPQAGQTVPHVHMHIIPRKKGDWANNDDIYDELDKGKKGVDNDERKPRSEKEMADEANELRVYFEQQE